MASLEHRTITRRGVLQGAATLAAAAALPVGFAPGAAASLVGGRTADNAQRFINIIPGGNGVIYAIDSVGNLFYYRHLDWATGGSTWGPSTGVPIGTEFNQFQTVLVDADGQFFCITADGAMYWNRFVLSDPATGAGSFVFSTGKQIGTGFDVATYPRIFGGWDGVIYAQDRQGNLSYYRYVTSDDLGNGTWLNGGEPASAGGGSGFNGYGWVCAGADGVIYGARLGTVWMGTLEWLRYDINTNTWDNGGMPVHLPLSGLVWLDSNSIKGMFCDNNGVIYVVLVDQTDTITDDSKFDDSVLATVRLLNYPNVTPGSGPVWQHPTASHVGTGFTYERSGALQGYASSLTIASGDPIQVAVSHGFATNAVTYEVLKVNGAGTGGTPTSVTGRIPLTVSGGIQPLPPHYRSLGCQWGFENPTNSANWTLKSTGLYAFRLHGPNGMHYDIPFAVTPGANDTKAPFAMLLPYNTYNAYNAWGGHCKYNQPAAAPWTSTFMRPSNVVNIDPNGHISHTLFNDLFLLSWMDQRNIAYDCYIDGDLDSGNLDLSNYKALVLGSHPEYWTDSMRAKLITHIDNGGGLIYTGGNGVYERMTYADGGDAATYLTVEGWRDFFVGDLPESTPPADPETLNVLDSGGDIDPQPYIVKKYTALLDGTGLNVGDTFGATAYNTAANGWECDNAVQGGSGTLDVVASGTTAAGGDLTFRTLPGGGWIFTAGSINFNSALPYDGNIAQILYNVFNYTPPSA